MSSKLKFVIVFVLTINMVLTIMLVNAYESSTKEILNNQNEIRKTVISIEQKQMGKLKDDEHLMLSLDGIHYTYEYWKYFKVVKR